MIRTIVSIKQSFLESEDCPYINSSSFDNIDECLIQQNADHIVDELSRTADIELELNHVDCNEISFIANWEYEEALQDLAAAIGSLLISLGIYSYTLSVSR